MELIDSKLSFRIGKPRNMKGCGAWHRVYDFCIQVTLLEIGIKKVVPERLINCALGALCKDYCTYRVLVSNLLAFIITNGWTINNS